MKITEIEKKLADHNQEFNTTPEFNEFSTDVFNARFTQANLITKTDFDAELSSLNSKIIANKTKHLLIENNFEKLKTFD